MQPRKLANLLSSWAYCLVGSTYAAYQVLIPRIIATLGGSTQAVSLLVASLFLGSVMTTLISGEISERYGKRTTLLIASSALATGCFLVFSANSIWLAIAGLMLSGFGIGGTEGSTLSIVEDANPDNSDRILCYVMALYGLGGFVVPLMIEKFTDGSAYRPVMIVFVLLHILSIVFTVFGKRIEEVCVYSGGNKDGLTVSIIWTNKTLLLSIIALAMFCGLESGLTYYATEVFGFFGNTSAGSYAVSAYWLAAMTGSFLAGTIKNSVKYLPSMLILGSICIAAVLLIPAVPFKLGIMLIAGILLGPVYSLTTYLGGHSAPENTGMAYAAMAFGASIGGVAFQPLAALAIGQFPVTAAYVLVI
ncbi:MAG: MFS transporter, partial [Oscillospiraceae bacterium]|nr:MFS transporter [Oscillospiraceae bacterium]